MGLFSKKKTVQRNLKLHGFPGHIDTSKCLYLAAEKGMKIDTVLLDLTVNEDQDTEYLNLSPFGKIPCLDDNQKMVCGISSILPYMDIKGAGKSLTPRKAAHLGEQNYWVEVGQTEVMPQVNTLLDELIIKAMTKPDSTSDKARIDSAVKALDRAFSLADEHLEGMDYFTNDFSFAEIHWLPYLHFTDITGHGELINKYPNLQRWFNQVKARKNASTLTYSALPSLEQIKGKELRFAA